MARTQGSRQTNTYRLLQLHPNAPRALIDEIYWSLAQRACVVEHTPDADQLRQAYVAVTRSDTSRGYATPPRAADATIDYYELLCLDPAADPQTIDLAHLLLSREEAGDASGMRQRLLDDAYRTLSNVDRRAQYDEARARASEFERTRAAPRENAVGPVGVRHGLTNPFSRRRDEHSPRNGREARLLSLRSDGVEG